MFEWIETGNGQKEYITWSPFEDATKYLQPSSKGFMINYRVENIEALVEEQEQDRITVLDEIETFEYGKFVLILCPENNKIELGELILPPTVK
jgi:hypothetical protein